MSALRTPGVAARLADAAMRASSVPAWVRAGVRVRFGVWARVRVRVRVGAWVRVRVRVRGHLAAEGDRLCRRGVVADVVVAVALGPLELAVGDGGEEAADGREEAVHLAAQVVDAHVELVAAVLEGVRGACGRWRRRR